MLCRPGLEYSARDMVSGHGGNGLGLMILKAFSNLNDSMNGKNGTLWCHNPLLMTFCKCEDKILIPLQWSADEWWQ